MITVTAYHKRAEDFCGLIPHMLREADSRPAAEQFNERYAHGGGWRPMAGWSYDESTGEISYPGDPALSPIASIGLRDETIIIYQHAWVAIIQANGDLEVARMD